jgi:release factor glutamine methyltransferase
MYNENHSYSVLHARNKCAKLACMNNYHDVTYYINYIREKLAVAYDDPTLCQQYAWWMLQSVCDKTRTELIIQETLMLSPEQKQQIDRWIMHLVDEHMPIQYLLGSVPFADLDILVEPPTLIPRPETEEWCLHIIEHLKLLDNTKIKILDIATGSGCIAIALAHHLPRARIIATDIADTALELTEKNIEHNLIRNVIPLQSDLYASIPSGERFDMIVSNPPYISADEFKDLDVTVTDWEDHGALVAADNGLAIIKQIIEQAPQFIQINNEMKQKNIPQLVIEIGYAQGAAVKELMLSAHYNDVLVHKDLEGKDRFVTGRIDNVANSQS